MMPSPRQQATSQTPSRLKVGVVAPGDTLLQDALQDAFDVQELTIASALRAPEQLGSDILVVDARFQSRLLEVARLCSEETFAVVVVARRTESAMQYLDVGATDVIWSGTPVAEVRARVSAAGRLAARTTDDWLTAGDVAISVRRMEVRRGGDRVHLTPTEFRLLEVLARNPGRVVSHRELMYEVWGPELLSARHYLRLYVRQLREKLEEDPSAPRILLTELGQGYRLAAEEARAVRAVGY